MKIVFIMVLLLTSLSVTESHADSLKLNLECKSNDGWSVSVRNTGEDPNDVQIAGNLNINGHASFEAVSFNGHYQGEENGYIVIDSNGSQFTYLNHAWGIDAYSESGQPIHENLSCN